MIIHLLSRKHKSFFTKFHPFFTKFHFFIVSASKDGVVVKRPVFRYTTGMIF